MRPFEIATWNTFDCPDQFFVVLLADEHGRLTLAVRRDYSVVHRCESTVKEFDDRTFHIDDPNDWTRHG